MINKEQQDHQCIECRRAYSPEKWFYSVQEYEDGSNLAESLTTQAERRREGLDWIEVAPKVEELTEETEFFWQFGFRIYDRDLYRAQMQEFIGIA